MSHSAEPASLIRTAKAIAKLVAVEEQILESHSFQTLKSVVGYFQHGIAHDWHLEFD